MNFEIRSNAVGRTSYPNDFNDRPDIGSKAGITLADPKLEEL